MRKLRWCFISTVFLFSGCGSQAVSAVNCQFKSYLGLAWTQPKVSSSCAQDCQNFVNSHPEQRPALCYQQLPQYGGLYSLTSVLTNPEFCSIGLTVQADLETSEAVATFLNYRLRSTNSLIQWLYWNNCIADDSEEKVLSISLRVSELNGASGSTFSLTAKFGSLIPEAIPRVEKARAALAAMSLEDQELCLQDRSACSEGVAYLYDFLPSGPTYQENFPLWLAIDVMGGVIFESRIIEKMISVAIKGKEAHLSVPVSPLTKEGNGWSTTGSYLSVGPTQ